MNVIFYGAVIALCVYLGEPLAIQKNESPSEDRYNFFDVELLQAVNQKENTNLLISPISIKLVLGMLMEGAEGITAEEIRSALRLSDDKEAARKEFDTWLSLLQVKGSQYLKIANNVFLSNSYSINPVYNKTLTKHYAAEATSLDFKNVKVATQTINNWVKNASSHMIQNIVEENQMTSNIKMMLASAVYFKGIWSTPFTKQRTAIKCFYTENNICQNTEMMKVTGFFDYGYISQLDATAISLPYEGDAFSMLLLLPGKKGGVQQLIRDLVHVSINSIKSEMTQQEVYLQVPKFELNHSDDLIEALKTLHISDAFTNSANLSNFFKLNGESTSVSRIFHSAKLTVDEEGTEAAAATGALFVPLMGGTTTSFIANRPFAFFIVDSIKNYILFAGKVHSPKLPQKQSPALNSSSVPSPTSKAVKVETPKFRSMNMINSSVSDSTNNINISSTSLRKRLQTRNSSYEALYDHFISNENKIKKKSVITPQSKNYKRFDDRRRHILIFA